MFVFLSTTRAAPLICFCSHPKNYWAGSDRRVSSLSCCLWLLHQYCQQDKGLEPIKGLGWDTDASALWTIPYLQKHVTTLLRLTVLTGLDPATLCVTTGLTLERWRTESCPSEKWPAKANWLNACSGQSCFTPCSFHSTCFVQGFKFRPLKRKKHLKKIPQVSSSYVSVFCFHFCGF